MNIVQSLQIYFGAVVFLPRYGATEITSLASSLFLMKLKPTQQFIRSSTLNKLQLSIQTSLLQSLPIAEKFESLFDLNVVFQSVEFFEQTNTSNVEFQVFTTLDGEELTGPTKFALDSVITRTFSQPSTKQGFLIQLDLSKDVILASIQNIAIELVDAPREPESPREAESQFSILDTALIAASGTILLGVVFIVYMQHRTRVQLDEDHFRGMDQGKSDDDCVIAANEVTQDLEDTVNVERTPNVDITASMDSDDDESMSEKNYHHGSLLQNTSIGKTRDDEYDKMFSIISSNFETIDAIYSPPVSPSPSVPSSSSGESPITHESSVISSPIAELPYSLEKVRSMKTESSPLAARLLRLPTIGSVDSRRKNKSSRSAVSAPGKLLVLNNSSGSSIISLNEDRSVNSLRSLRSIRSGSRLFQVIEHPDLEASNTNLTDLAVISEQNILATLSTEYERNWGISERLAENDDDSSSVVDVFHVGHDQNSAEDVQSRMSGLSAVSDWMKSIRVVGEGSVNSNTSDMSKSSAENSSVEAKSLSLFKENSSIDYSLEKSLAKSIVEM